MCADVHSKIPNIEGIVMRSSNNGSEFGMRTIRSLEPHGVPYMKDLKKS